MTETVTWKLFMILSVKTHRALFDLYGAAAPELARDVGWGIQNASSLSFAEGMLPVSNVEIPPFVFVPKSYTEKECCWGRQFIEAGFWVLALSYEGDYLSVRSEDHEALSLWFLGHEDDYDLVSPCTAGEKLNWKIEDFLAALLGGDDQVPASYMDPSVSR